MVFFYFRLAHAPITRACHLWRFYESTRFKEIVMSGHEKRLNSQKTGHSHELWKTLEKDVRYTVLERQKNLICYTFVTVLRYKKPSKTVVCCSARTRLLGMYNLSAAFRTQLMTQQLMQLWSRQLASTPITIKPSSHPYPYTRSLLGRTFHGLKEIFQNHQYSQHTLHAQLSLHASGKLGISTLSCD